MKPLRVAVAGAGYFCQFQLDGWKRIPGVELAVSHEQGRRVEIAQMR